MRILLVEDDLAQLELLQVALSQAGHVVDGIEDGAIAQWAISQKDYDLLILDWLLPEVSGLDLCRQYRQAGKTAPVLMLSAKHTSLDKVAGLDAGADDYLVKPADLFELLARVRALGRRSLITNYLTSASCWHNEILQLGDLQLHLLNLTVTRGQTTVELSAREFQLLEYFMRHPRQVLIRNQIEQALWEWGNEPESNATTTLVRRLRQRLQAVNAANWIESIYGMGYRINPK